MNGANKPVFLPEPLHGTWWLVIMKSCPLVDAD